jgi:glycosyltransferase involved in cell wall biosynthesis
LIAPAAIVSVIVPVYRGEQFVAAAIESVLEQTYRSFELVIVNDGSPDDSDRVIRRFLPHPQIKYIEQANGGVAAARNTGLANANGTFVALLDQDDVWLPQKLDRQVAYLEAHPHIGLVHTRVECMDARGEPCSCIKAIGVIPLEGFCSGQLLLGNGIAPLTVLMRRHCIEEVGGFDQRFAPTDDWDLWLRIARRYPLGFMDEVTARYRVHHEMVSKDRFKMQQAALALVDSICERFPDIYQSLPAAELARARSRSLVSAAEALEAQQCPAEARDYFRKAYRAKPNIEALLALLGLSARWRGRLLLRGTFLRRVLAWYMHKARNAAPHFVTRPNGTHKRG